MTIRVVIVDDQELIRVGFRLILQREADLEVVGEAADGAQALDVVASVHPDVVLMDIRMPVMDGIEATRRLSNPAPAGAVDVADASGAPPPRVLILTTFDLDEHVYDALAAGASGFLLKDVKADLLTDAIRTLYAGDALLAPAITRRLIATFAGQRPTPPATPEATTTTNTGKALEELTPREREVLVLIAEGRSNAEISETLVLSPATVKTHIGRIFTKLNARDRAQAVVIAYQNRLVSAP